MHYFFVIWVTLGTVNPVFNVGCSSAEKGFDLIDFNKDIEKKTGLKATVVNFFETDKVEYEKCLKEYAETPVSTAPLKTQKKDKK